MPITENAKVVIERRIAKKDKEGNPLETAEDVFTRVADNVAKADYNYGKTDDQVHSTKVKFYNMMQNLDFLPNSPTLVNAGRELQQLSACFVIPVEDSMEGIFEGIKQAALIHKTGGGTGFSFSRLRPANSIVDATSGIASGPVSFMQVFDKATEVIKQGGTRRGANMGILRVDHPDILEFIHVKDDLSKLQNFNISVAITDTFMNALATETSYDLIDPRNGEVVGTLDAKDVWAQLVESAHRTGDPGIIFIDRINAGKANPVPYRGPIESTNPCGEQPLYPWDSCNLGSINLSNFVTDDSKVDFARLADVTQDAVHFLDNVIDMNEWPNEEIAKVSKSIRRIGLGVMGWADMLIKMKIEYGSEESFKLAEQVMGCIRGEADKKSIELGMSRGNFPDFESSIYSDWPALRNATRTTIAPTGTISIIAGCSSGIEPLFALEFTRSHYLDKDPNKRYEMTERHPEYEAWCNSGEQVLPDYFKTADTVHPAYHVMMQAMFQRYTDNAVSKTINFPKEATVPDVEAAYLQAWLQGCNGITVYRDGSRAEQVLSVRGTESGEESLSVSSNDGNVEPEQSLPGVSGVNEEPAQDSDTREGIVHKVTLGDFEGYIIAGVYPSGALRDCFIVGNKVGSATRGYLDTIGILVSLLLRKGVPVLEITNKLSGIRFEPSGFSGNPDIRVSTSIVDYLARWLELTSRKNVQGIPVESGGYGTPDTDKIPHGDLCAECGSTMYYGEGCLTCLSCGWSKCG
jgi:ribonucleoside-diphosphate reductase alpha chain